MVTEIVANEKRRVYHLHRLVTSHYIGSLYKMTMDGNDVQTRTDIHPVLQDVMDTPGVEEIYPQAYSITVHKGGAYTWDEIEEQVLPILRNFEAEQAALIDALLGTDESSSVVLYILNDDGFVEAGIVDHESELVSY